MPPFERRIQSILGILTAITSINLQAQKGEGPSDRRLMTKVNRRITGGPDFLESGGRRRPDLRSRTSCFAFRGGKGWDAEQ